MADEARSAKPDCARVRRALSGRRARRVVHGRHAGRASAHPFSASRSDRPHDAASRSGPGSLRVQGPRRHAGRPDHPRLLTFRHSRSNSTSPVSTTSIAPHLGVGGGRRASSRSSALGSASASRRTSERFARGVPAGGKGECALEPRQQAGISAPRRLPHTTPQPDGELSCGGIRLGGGPAPSRQPSTGAPGSDRPAGRVRPRPLPRCMAPSPRIPTPRARASPRWTRPRTTCRRDRAIQRSRPGDSAPPPRAAYSS